MQTLNFACKQQLANRHSRHRTVAVRASGNGSSQWAFSEGANVKVVKPIKVYHAPKHPNGLDIQGMEGVIVKNAAEYKGKVLSANFPYRVEFKITVDGKDTKFQTHLGEEELQAAQ